MSSIEALPIQRLPRVSEEHVRGLARLLIDCVDGGASVSFMHPLSPYKAENYWRRIGESVARGERALLVAEDDAGIAASVHLVLEQPENQPHRADVAKMLVHRRARRQGLGAALMRAAEELARKCGKTLLVLDTVTGGDAERLYARIGWERCGSIPNYALMPDGAPCATTYFFRKLPPLEDDPGPA